MIDRLYESATTTMLITTMEAATLAVIAKTLRSLFRPEPNIPAFMMAAIERLDVPPTYKLAGSQDMTPTAGLR